MTKYASRFAASVVKPLMPGVVACLTWSAPQVAEAGTEAASRQARVERLVSERAAVSALPPQVLCREQAMQGGRWLLVSRSWGGSPSLRQYQLLAWPDEDQVLPQRMAVTWGECISGATTR